jgi:hypothetical protein
LRKLLTGAVVASASLAVAAGAIAQDPDVKFTGKASPTKVGTKKKPKNTTLSFDMKVDKPGTTVEFIDLSVSKGLKFSGKGLGNCTFADLEHEGPTACSDDKAGPKGTASAVLTPGDLPLRFTVEPFVQDANSLLFYIASAAGEAVQVQTPIRGEITGKGRKLRITIPESLRQPPGLDASLTGLNQLFTRKKGKRYVVSSTGCTGGKHKFTAKLTFSARRDDAPVPPPSTSTATSTCKK